MPRIYIKTLSVAETEIFLGEKPETGRSVTVVTLMSGEGFAVKKSQFMAGRVS